MHTSTTRKRVITPTKFSRLRFVLIFAIGWFILPLPYVEPRPLYDRCDFSEDWNGPANAALTTVRIKVLE